MENDGSVSDDITPEKHVLRRCRTKTSADGSVMPAAEQAAWSPKELVAAVKEAKGKGKTIPKDLAIALANTVKGMKGKGKGMTDAATEPVGSSGWINPRKLQLDVDEKHGAKAKTADHTATRDEDKQPKKPRSPKTDAAGECEKHKNKTADDAKDEAPKTKRAGEVKDKKKKKKPCEEAEDEAPKKKSKPGKEKDEEAEDEAPKKNSAGERKDEKKKKTREEAEDEAAKKNGKEEDEEAEREAPKKNRAGEVKDKKKPCEEAEDEAPKKNRAGEEKDKKKKPCEEADDEAAKKKKQGKGEDEEVEDEAPKKNSAGEVKDKKKKKCEEAEDEAPKKKSKPGKDKDEEAEDEAPKKNSAGERKDEKKKKTREEAKDEAPKKKSKPGKEEDKAPRKKNADSNNDERDDNARSKMNAADEIDDEEEDLAKTPELDQPTGETFECDKSLLTEQERKELAIHRAIEARVQKMDDVELGRAVKKAKKHPRMMEYLEHEIGLTQQDLKDLVFGEEDAMEELVSFEYWLAWVDGQTKVCPGDALRTAPTLEYPLQAILDAPAEEEAGVAKMKQLMIEECKGVLRWPRVYPYKPKETLDTSIQRTVEECWYGQDRQPAEEKKEEAKKTDPPLDRTNTMRRSAQCLNTPICILWFSDTRSKSRTVVLALLMYEGLLYVAMMEDFIGYGP